MGGKFDSGKSVSLKGRSRDSNKAALLEESRRKREARQRQRAELASAKLLQVCFRIHLFYGGFVTPRADMGYVAGLQEACCCPCPRGACEARLGGRVRLGDETWHRECEKGRDFIASAGSDCIRPPCCMEGGRPSGGVPLRTHCPTKRARSTFRALLGINRCQGNRPLRLETPNG